MKKILPSTAVVLVAALSCASCIDYWIHRAVQKALREVARELQPAAHIPADALRAKPSPIGEGLFVYPADVVERGQPAIVWLIKGGKPYALNETTRRLTPTLPGVDEIPKELLTSAEQSGELEAMVWNRLNDPTFQRGWSGFHLERP
jgi:hypothetical protein